MRSLFSPLHLCVILLQPPTDPDTMCRLLGYLGQPISLDRILNQPEHSLIVQSYQPQQMTSETINADGFDIS